MYDWHQKVGHRNMKSMVHIANGAVTGMVLETYLKTCRGRAAAKAQRIPFKTGRTRATTLLKLVAGRMREYCEHKGFELTHRYLSNGVAERLVSVATNGTRAMVARFKSPAALVG